MTRTTSGIRGDTGNYRTPRDWRQTVSPQPARRRSHPTAPVVSRGRSARWDAAGTVTSESEAPWLVSTPGARLVRLAAWTVTAIVFLVSGTLEHLLLGFLVP